MNFDVLIHGASEVVTCTGTSGPAEERLAIQRGASIGINGDRIAWIGVDAKATGTLELDALGGFVGPGFVDCHTHVVFAGDRSTEFEQRTQGKTYLEIAAAGGGIARTVIATRAATEDELIALARPRLERLLRHGVTTVEIKSGYGLSAESELRMLSVIDRLAHETPMTVIPTLLALHSIPVEFKEKRGEWLRIVNEELLPRVAADKLARFADVFVEQTAFTHDEARVCMEAARKVGLSIRMHVDQLTANGGAQLAASLGSVTADHLEQISADGIAALAKAGTIAVLAPTSTLFAKARPFAPGRALCDAGVRVAICTNCNPGSSHSENVFLALGLACVENGLTPAEAYLGFTRYAADAVLEPERGRLAVGSPADLVIYDCPSYRDLPYHFAMNDVAHVLRAGRPVF
ncbi:MAG: imidazolonepropionase [Archangium sp.]|nr:imidazolonepropionase [Archangium sp.]